MPLTRLGTVPTLSLSRMGEFPSLLLMASLQPLYRQRRGPRPRRPKEKGGLSGMMMLWLGSSPGLQQVTRFLKGRHCSAFACSFAGHAAGHGMHRIARLPRTSRMWRPFLHSPPMLYLVLCTSLFDRGRKSVLQIHRGFR